MSNLTYLNFMEKYKQDINSVLDIGANVGVYSSIIHEQFPDIDIFMIEANPFCDTYLKRTSIPYEIVCLSDTNKFIQMYVNKNNSVCTGASYYRETTQHYTDAEYVNVNTKLLDDVILNKFNEHKKFDFIKMDTQGSELDIIRGGRKIIDQAKFIQLELSIIEYNKGAPLKDEVLSFMQSINFKPVELVEKHYWNQNPTDKIIQEDWIFTR